MSKIWPDDFPRGKVEPVNDKLIRELWEEVARARRERGDKVGSKQAFRNARVPKSLRRLTKVRRLYQR
jgi:hypothetical protein